MWSDVAHAAPVVTPSATLPAHHTLRFLAAPLGVVFLALLLFGGAVVISHVWWPGFIVLSIAFISLMAYAATIWPRAVIVVVVLSPILDRYVVADLLPPNLETVTHLLSEGLLVGVGGTLGIKAWREGRLRDALWHPAVAALAAFAALSLISALVNAVEPQVAFIGLAFTVDAAALFVLPRMVGYSLRQALLAVGAFVAIVGLAAAIAVAQAILSPDILGLTGVEGRFGEAYRLGSFLRDPNILGAFLITAAPFVLLSATILPRTWMRRAAIAIAFLLILALWLSFSRGAWAALLVGVGAVIGLLDRRTLLLGLAITVASFGTAVVLPRDLVAPPRTGAPGEGDPLGEERPDLIGSTIGRVQQIGEGRDLRTLFILNALPIIADHPLLGVGPGRYGGAVADTFESPIYAEYHTDELFLDPTQRTVDDFWLHVLVEIGILGLAALLAAAAMPLLAILSKARRSIGWRKILLGGVAAGAAGLAVDSITTMLLEANSAGFVFWFLLGIGVIVAAAPADQSVETIEAIAA